MTNWLTSLFVGSERRQRYRQRMGRSWLQDMLWHSSAYEYRGVRATYNLPLGIAVAWVVYKFALERLGIGAFDPTYEDTFRVFVIALLSLAYSWSPLFRATMLCALTLVSSRTGQRMLLLEVASNTMAANGPIDNIVYNYNQGR